MKIHYSQVVEGMAISLAGQIAGIEDEDEIDYITEQIVTMLEEENDAALDAFMLTLSPKQLIVAGAVVSSVAKSWLADDETQEYVPGYV